MNDSWGFHAADDNWTSPKTAVRNLITCARGGGNYLLNIGPRPDGSIPEESVRILTKVGEWMDKNGAAIYGTPIVANGAIYLQSNTHLFAFADPTKQSGLKDEPQKLDLPLKK